MKWKGVNWVVRDNTTPQGPGENLFSSKNVLFGDSIQLEARDGTCAEVVLDEVLDYGTYEIEVERECLPKNVIFGIFLYEDDKHEVDVEFGRWNKFFNLNAQLVNQEPFSLSRWFSFKKKNTIRFYYGKNIVTVECDNKTRIFEVKLTKPKLHVNLWLHESKSGKARSYIKNFRKLKGG